MPTHLIWFLCTFYTYPIPYSTFVISYILRFWTPKLRTVVLRSMVSPSEDLIKSTNFLVSTDKLLSTLFLFLSKCEKVYLTYFDRHYHLLLHWHYRLQHHYYLLHLIHHQSLENCHCHYLIQIQVSCYSILHWEDQFHLKKVQSLILI